LQAEDGGVIAYVEELVDVQVHAATIEEARVALHAAMELTIACNRMEARQASAGLPDREARTDHGRQRRLGQRSERGRRIAVWSRRVNGDGRSRTT
jgi:predicted RNase H-like HicB family nuclease